jgi:argininosuccinate synthase
VDKVILAYSGGLDTSVAIPWLHEHYGMDVIAVTADVGNERDFTAIREKALRTGASTAYVVDAKDLFVQHFVFPALQAGAIYGDAYPLATALARPLIAKILVDYARQEGASAVAHGCTGKGNDQVRFDVSVGALAPDLKVIAPVREWRWSRDEEIKYAADHGIPVPITASSPYSIDENLWGRSVEAGVLEDPWAEPPDDVWQWTTDPARAPDAPAYVAIEFERGIPVGLDGERLDGVTLIERLNALAGAHGVGRLDQVEDRLVGIKSREIYEAPAGVVLHTAHSALEQLTLSKDQALFKREIAKQLATLIYNGLWFSAHHQDLAAYVASSQRFVSGTVQVRLYKGACRVTGRKSPHSLYNAALATYDKGDTFSHEAALGFIELWGLPLRTQAAAQLLTSGASESLGLPGADGQALGPGDPRASRDPHSSPPNRQ